MSRTVSRQHHSRGRWGQSWCRRGAAAAQVAQALSLDEAGRRLSTQLQTPVSGSVGLGCGRAHTGCGAGALVWRARFSLEEGRPEAGESRAGRPGHGGAGVACSSQRGSVCLRAPVCTRVSGRAGVRVPVRIAGVCTACFLGSVCGKKRGSGGSSETAGEQVRVCARLPPRAAGPRGEPRDSRAGGGVG